MQVSVTGAKNLPPSCVVLVDAGGERRCFAAGDLIDAQPLSFPVAPRKDDNMPCTVEVLHPLSCGKIELLSGSSDYEVRVGGTISCVAMLPKQLGIHLSEGIQQAGPNPAYSIARMVSKETTAHTESITDLKRQVQQAQQDAKNWRGKYEDANTAATDLEKRLKIAEEELSGLRGKTPARMKTSVPSEIIQRLESVSDVCQELSSSSPHEDQDMPKLQAQLSAQGKAITSISDNLGSLRDAENEKQVLRLELEHERSCMEILRQRNAELLHERQQLWEEAERHRHWVLKEEAERHRHWVACQASADLGLLASGRLERPGSRSPAKVPPLATSGGSLSAGPSASGRIGQTLGSQPSSNGSSPGPLPPSPVRHLSPGNLSVNGRWGSTTSPSRLVQPSAGPAMLDQVNKLETLLQSLKNLDARTPRTPRS